MTQNFVSPELCKELFDAGLFFGVKFFWLVKENSLELCTKEFDPDEYYEGANLMIDVANPTKSVLPAYSIKDIEKLLPDYDLRQRGGSYFLQTSTPHIRHNGTVEINVEDERLPDALAKFLHDCVTNDIVSLDKANYVLAYAA